MAPNIHGQMVYSFAQPMWHAITEPSLIPMGAEEILKKRFQGGFEVILRPLTVLLNGSKQEYGGFAIVRGTSPYEPEEIVFNTCTKRFHPLQPLEICRSFDENVKQPAETMAFLGHGEDMFISWTMPEFDVRPGDSLKLYGIVRSGFDTLHGPHLFTSIVRPVCWNTITLAEEWAKRNTDGKGQGNIWKGKGTSLNLLRDLGYWMEHVQGKAQASVDLLQNFFKVLANTPIKNDVEAHEIIADAYPYTEDTSAYYPNQLRTAKAEKIATDNMAIGEVRNGIFELFTGAGTAITPDYFGMANATSEFYCHVFASKKPIAESVMFGGRQASIQKMVKTLSDRVR